MRRLFEVIGIGLLIVAGQSPGQSRLHAPDEQRVRRREGKAFSDLIKDLRARGATVKLLSERVSQPVFSVRGRILLVSDEPVWIFSYPTTIKANNDAAKISADGMTIGNSKPSWLGTPHFFRKPRMIVLYLGDEPRLLDILNRAIGRQFAGG